MTKEKNSKKRESFLQEKIRKYKELPNTTRRVINLWVIIVLILIIIIIICNINNKHLAKYENIEKKMQSAAIKYAEDKNLKGTDTEKVRIDMEVLVSDNYLEIDKKYSKKCVGYALVYNNRDDEVKAKPYLSCKGYSTEGFSIK